MESFRAASNPPPASVVDRSVVGGSELVAALLPDARVMKAFDNLYGPVIAADPRSGRGVRLRAGGPRAADDGSAHAGGRAVDRAARHPRERWSPHPLAVTDLDQLSSGRTGSGTRR